MAEITLEQVTAAEEALIAAKDGGDRKKVKAAKEKLAPLRQAYRVQEVAAGRREPGTAVTGDAKRVGG